MLSACNNALPSNKSDLVCPARHISKSHKLPFSLSQSKAFLPLELIHANLWGPISQPSKNGARYFLLFLDDHSRFTWLYILHSKYKVYYNFFKFKIFFERQFGLPIKALQIDNGAEFKVLSSFLSTHGISHRLSYPYIPEQNGRVERKIYHIIETGLTFFNNAYMPLKYWSFSFQTTILLINIIHIPILSHLYP